MMDFIQANLSTIIWWVVAALLAVGAFSYRSTLEFWLNHWKYTFPVLGKTARLSRHGIHGQGGWTDSERTLCGDRFVVEHRQWLVPLPEQCLIDVAGDVSCGADHPERFPQEALDALRGRLPAEPPPPPQPASMMAATAMKIPVYFVFVLSLPSILWFAAHLHMQVPRRTQHLSPNIL